MIRIVVFRMFDTPAEKVFFNGESIDEIHRVLSGLCNTYVPGEVITCARMLSSLPEDKEDLNVLKTLQKNNTQVEKF